MRRIKYRTLWFYYVEVHRRSDALLTYSGVCLSYKARRLDYSLAQELRDRRDDRPIYDVSRSACSQSITKAQLLQQLFSLHRPSVYGVSGWLAGWLAGVTCVWTYVERALSYQCQPAPPHSKPLKLSTTITTHDLSVEGRSSVWLVGVADTCLC